MHKWLVYIIALSALLSLNSCFEFIESYHFKNDKSGTANYIINLSQSKLILSALLAKDSINGKAVPSKEEININLKKTAQELNNIEGISQCIINSDWEHYVFKCSFNFKHTNALKNIQEKLKTEQPNEMINVVFDFNGSVFNKQLPDFSDQDKSQANEALQKMGFDAQNLKNAKLTFIYRFDKEIASFNNGSYQLSGNKKAIMFSTSNLNQNTKLNTNVKVILK